MSASIVRKVYERIAKELQKKHTID